MKTIQELNQKILNDFDKDVTELVIELFKSEKEIKALLMTLNKKENELNQSKNALQELQLTFQHVQQKLVRP